MWFPNCWACLELKVSLVKSALFEVLSLSKNFSRFERHFQSFLKSSSHFWISSFLRSLSTEIQMLIFVYKILYHFPILLVSNFQFLSQFLLNYNTLCIYPTIMTQLVWWQDSSITSSCYFSPYVKYTRKIIHSVQCAVGSNFFFFQCKTANSFYSKINDSSRVRRTAFSSSRFGVRVSVVPNIFTIYP